MGHGPVNMCLLLQGKINTYLHLPGFARDKNKPLAEYDGLEGEPFWLQ